MTKDYLRRLFEYDLWANNRVLQALEAAAPLEASSPIARLFSHIIAAQQIWLVRVQGEALSGGVIVWPEMEPALWPGMVQSTHAAWLDQLDVWQADLDASVSYHNTKGQAFETPLHEIVTHVVIHGQHHRAQIALHLRERGHVPPATDFAFFTREGTGA